MITRASDLFHSQTLLVPGAGIEPAREVEFPRDFKSLVSTSFTIRAVAN
jgi:hypothetical protein